MKWKPFNGKALRDVNTLPTWEALVSKVHLVTNTAAFFARYCFIRALDENPAFHLQAHIEKDIFFTEIMKTFVDKRRTTASTPETRSNSKTNDATLPTRPPSTIINPRKKQSLGYNPMYFYTKDQPSVHVI